MLKGLMKYLIAALVGYAGGIAYLYFLSPLPEGITTRTFNIAYFTDLIPLGAAAMLVFVMFLLSLNKIGKGDLSKNEEPTAGKNKYGEKLDQFYSARWVTDKELKTNPKFRFCKYSGLKTRSDDGIPVRAELVHGETEVNMVKPIHTIVIGTTGSGKTTMFVDPTIQILSETKSKPSMVISDPKGELYNHNLLKLQKCGYDVKCIDLREPDKSARWNPIERAFDAYQRAHKLHEEVKQVKGKKPSEMPKVLTIPNVVYGEEWYLFDGVAYPNLDLLKQDMLAMKDKLINVAMEDITDITETLCPITGNEPSWPRGAQGLIRGIMIAMLEDSLIPELHMTKDRFNFYNLYKISSLRDPGNDNIVTLRNYFQGRAVTSMATDLAATVVNNAAQTSKGYLGHVTGALQTFSDTGICYLTSGTDIDFSTFSDKPTALFIKIPDEKDTRHAIANIFITQLYKMLIERANVQAKKTGGEPELPRNVYFLLDEFGNLPKIEKLKSFITAGRSRKIFLALVIQDYTQLNSIYGEQDAATIRNNCNIHIFIGTKDAKTREEFSKNCGNTAIVIENKSKSVNTGTNPMQDEGSGGNIQKSKQNVQRPLIDPNELDHLQPYQVVVNMFGEFSMKTYFTPTYKNPQYSLKKPPIQYIPSKYLDQEKVYYDIKKRNAFMLKSDLPVAYACLKD